MKEFEVNGQQYRAEKLNAFKQWDLTRKLLPIVSGSADVLIKLFKDRTAPAKDGGAAVALSVADVLNMNISDVVGPLAKALAEIPDADSDFVMKTCLSVVQRKSGPVWSPLMTPAGHLAFALDVEMPQMLQIVWAVLEDNLLSFTFALPVDSKSAG